MLKDLELATTTAQLNGVTLPQTALAEQMFQPQIISVFQIKTILLFTHFWQE